jgi:branched-chain amino acid transport system substrate-binding protein
MVKRRRAIGFGLLLLGMLPSLASAQEGPLKIGVLTDISGPFATIVGENSVEAARMAVEDAGGTVVGRKIEIVAGDHQNKADIGANIARRWFDTENVEVIVDVPVSSVALAVQAVAREKKKVVLFSSGLTDRLSNEDCAPYSVQWMLDTNVLARGTVKSILEGGGDTWFFISADYAFGHSMEKISRDMITASGGKFVGSVKNPLNTPDMSSFLLQAQASKAKIIGVANVGQDFRNIVIGAADFGLIAGGQRLASMIVYDSDIISLGLDKARGLYLTTAFYWDLDDGTRTFAERFFKRRGTMPNMIQASIYSSVNHYLKAAKATGGFEPDKILPQMRATPVNDFFAKDGKLRPDGLMQHDTFLMEVKAPSESKSKWDILKLVRRIPGDVGYAPLADSKCSTLAK